MNTIEPNPSRPADPLRRVAALESLASAPVAPVGKQRGALQ